MTADPRDPDALGDLLRGLPAPEPSPDFLAGARRRYAQALDARHRLQVLVVLVAASACLVAIAGVLLLTFDVAALLGFGAVAVAEFARWATAVAAVASIIPLEVWESTVILFIATTLPIVVLARSRLPGG